MATRTYRISLVGEDAATSAALDTLGRLFDGAGLQLLKDDLSGRGLQVQRLAADALEVVLFVTPAEAPGAAAAMQQEAPLAPQAHGGGGGMGSEEPPR